MGLHRWVVAAPPLWLHTRPQAHTHTPCSPCPAAPNLVVEVSVGGPLLARSFAQHSLALSARDAAFAQRIEELTLAGTHSAVTYPRQFDGAGKALTCELPG